MPFGLQVKVIMVVFGGLGTFAGPLIGAPAIVIISELTRGYGAWNMVFYSLAVIIIIRLYREGLVSLIRKGMAKIASLELFNKGQSSQNP